MEIESHRPPLKCAVIGVGYLGKFHAQKYAALPDCDLVAVVDRDPETAGRVARDLNTQALSDYRPLLDQIDAVSIVVPTSQHYAIAKEFLMAGIHVLVEKPITVTLEQADELIALAEAGGRVLQVGHLERFNAALMALDSVPGKPVLFIESHRLAPFNPRANDVSVVLDLMIHDIDIILSLVGSPIARIDASGASILTRDVDIANARLVFSDGCVANVTASRVSMKMERKMRIFRSHRYTSIDFQNRTLTHHQTGDEEMYPGVPAITTERMMFDNNDALLEEIKHFCACIRHRRQPLVSGQDGRSALATAIAIGHLLEKEKDLRQAG